MTLLTVVLLSAAVLLLAYRIYGKALTRLLRLDRDARTPAVVLRDDVDYVPIEPKFLMSQHFSAIAAAGPIVGPILAGVMFGWLPALLWILIGSIFIGGVHDMTSLVASIRHKARSIADVVREHMSKRSYLLFLLFIWIALIYIIVAFTDLVADSFVGTQDLGGGRSTTGGAVATASLLYLALPVIMGLLLKYTKLPLGLATAIFLPLVAISVWLGPIFPLDINTLFHLTEAASQRWWGVALLAYCFIASIVPMWLLLQPRGHLGGYFLVVVLLGGIVGVLIGAATGRFQADYPAFTGWTAPNGASLFPMLFITIACGACSGFHSIIASGTTSKQLHRETDAKPVGYGAMLLEAMVAVLSLTCVMVLAKGSPVLEGNKVDVIYAYSLSRFLNVLYVPTAFAYTFVALALTTFVYDTLDVCTRLGRYILQELIGVQGRTGRVISTAITVCVPLIFLLWQPVGAGGKIESAWKIFWPLFGASNQLLAALALLGVTVWLWRTYRAKWIWFATGLPTVVMYVMSSWALIAFIRKGFTPAFSITQDTTGEVHPFASHFLSSLPRSPVPWAALVLLTLALLVLAEAVRVFTIPPGGSTTESLPVTA